jgi:hypothetical protein
MFPFEFFAEEIKSNDEGCDVKRDVDECGNFLIISRFKWQKDSIEKQTIIIFGKLLHVVQSRD